MGKLYLGTQAITPFVYDKAEDTGIPREISQSGVYQMPSSSFTYTLPTGVTDLGDHALNYAFYGCTGLASVDLSGLTNISGVSGGAYAFYQCPNITSIDLSSLTSVARSGLAHAFQGCTNLASIDLINLATINLTSLSYAFARCTSLTSVTFSSLSTLNGDTSSSQQAMVWAFWGCTSLSSLSFPALTANSFVGGKGQFENMLNGCSGVTLHFPSGLSSTIPTLTGYGNGFGGTNTTILYDL